MKQLVTFLCFAMALGVATATEPSVRPSVFCTKFVPPDPEAIIPLDGPQPSKSELAEAMSKHRAVIKELKLKGEAEGTIMLEKLKSAQEVELISLDPTSYSSTSGQPSDMVLLDEFKITGKATLANQQQIPQLASALEHAIRTSSGESADCFEPHHALRFKSAAKTYVVVICFQCGSGYFRTNEDRNSEIVFTILPTEESKLDAFFSELGLRKQSKPKAIITSPPRNP